jgi:predicted RNase H-like nuclease
VTVFAGVDLAWSGLKPTGRCVLRHGPAGLHFESLDCATLTGVEVAAWLGTLGPRVIAGIDAPLVVSPTRRAEAEMARVYGSRGVYAYAPRPDFLQRHGIAEGPRLGGALTMTGWSLDPFSNGERRAIEVFPHAAIVALYGAARALRYKKGPLAGRMEPLRDYQRLILTHMRSEAPDLLTSPLGDFVCAPIEPASMRSVKDTEDRLDALTCALSAYHIWRHGSPGTRVFGNATCGYIAVPVEVAPP